MGKKLFKDATIITCNRENEVIQGGSLGIEDGKIIFVGKEPENTGEYDEIISLNGDYVLPGLINTHGHTPMSLLRGFADDLPLQTWLEERIWPMEEQYTPEIAKWGAYLSIIEMIRTGTTAFVDMYDNMDEVAQAVDSSGMRARLCRGVIGFGPEEIRAAKLKEATEFARNWHRKGDGRITTMMAPHSPYTCDPAYIEQIVAKAEELDLPVHIHMSETEKEVEQNVVDYGCRPVKHLENLGVFDRPTLVAHAVHLNDDEIDILARNDVKVSHNIVSNLKLGSGIAPVKKMLEKGITISLGTDSSASNNNLDLFEEIKLAAVLHKGIERDAVLVTAETALLMGTRFGAEALWLDDQIGSLEIGKEADFIVIDTKSPFYEPRVNDPVSHVVYAGSGRDVKDVFVKGKAIMKDRELLTVDEEKVYFEANRVRKLLKL